MNAVKQFLLEQAFASEVRQSSRHADNIRTLYLMIRVACENEFTEDTPRSLDAFLRELFDLTQWHGPEKKQ